MKIFVAAALALGLLGAPAASAADVGVGVHIGDVGVHVGGDAGRHHHDRYDRRDYRDHHRWNRHYRHHERYCRSWGWHHHHRVCRYYGWRWTWR